jgi:intracellular sulfur oxidation DsrE/DsrF family protein
MKDFEWKAVLALNNAAITMMKRSDFHQAADTLKDAMRVLAEGASEPSHTERAFITEKLQKANHCIFNPTESTRTTPSKSSIKVIHHDGAVDGLTVDAAILQVNACPNASRYLVIRLESSDVEIKEAHAILVHNYAICWFQENRNTAKLLLQASLGILSQLHDDAACPFVMHRTISLMKITGDALAQAMEAMQEEEEALSLRTNLLESLYKRAQELASSGMFLPTSASPVA